MLAVGAELAYPENPTRALAITSLHFGVRAPGLTFEAVAHRYGVTRERVRQIECRVVHHLIHTFGRWDTPALARAQEVLVRAAGRTEHDSATQLAGALGAMSLRDVLRFLAALHPQAFPASLFRATQGPGTTRVLGTRRQLEIARAIPATARRMGAERGACYLPDLQAWAGSTYPADDVRVRAPALIMGLSGLTWHDAAHTWFTVRDWPASRLIRTATLILAWAQRPVSVAEIREGWLRDRRPGRNTAGTAPPDPVVHSLLRQHREWFEQDRDGGYRWIGHEPTWLRLGGVEQLVVEALRAAGAPLRRSALRAAIRGRMPTLGCTALSPALQYSPCIVRLAHGVYALRGAARKLPAPSPLA